MKPTKSRILFYFKLKLIKLLTNGTSEKETIPQFSNDRTYKFSVLRCFINVLFKIKVFNEQLESDYKGFSEKSAISNYSN